MIRVLPGALVLALWCAIIWYVAVPMAFDAAMVEQRAGETKFVVGW